jgi:hypothetical protein
MGWGEAGTVIATVLGLIALGGYLRKPLKSIIESGKYRNAAMRALLRNAIARAHREFTAKGFIDRYALDSALDMYKQYKFLEGNGYIDGAVKELGALPVIEIRGDNKAGV